MASNKSFLLGVMETSVGEEIAVIPSCWKNGANTCVYPNFKNPEKTKAAIKKSERPAEGWQQYGLEYWGLTVTILSFLHVYCLIDFYMDQ